MAVSRAEYKRAILQGGNPDGPYDVDPEDRIDVLVELGVLERPKKVKPEPEPDPKPAPKKRKYFRKK